MDSTSEKRRETGSTISLVDERYFGSVSTKTKRNFLPMEICLERD